MGSYGEDKTVVRRKIEKTTKMVYSCFVEMMILIHRPTIKLCAWEVLEVKHFGESLCLNCTEFWKQSSIEGIGAKDGEYVVPPSPSSRV